MKCKHCEFIEKTFKPILTQLDSTKREYWLMTEVFVYLHNGKDCCGEVIEKNKPFTLQDFYEEYRRGFNPVTGEQNLFKDITDEMIFEAGFKTGMVGKLINKEQAEELLLHIYESDNCVDVDFMRAEILKDWQNAGLVEK